MASERSAVDVVVAENKREEEKDATHLEQFQRDSPPSRVPPGLADLPSLSPPGHLYVFLTVLDASCYLRGP